MNRVVLGELFLESLPQLMVQSYNEAQLDQVSTVFIVSVLFSVCVHGDSSDVSFWLSDADQASAVQ